MTTQAGFVYNLPVTLPFKESFVSTFSTRTLPVIAVLALNAFGSTAALAQKPAKPANPIATIQTTKGVIKVKLYPEETPKTVANFVKLSRQGFYNGLMFHRVEPSFVVQGGDPKSRKLPVGHPELGTGGPGYEIKNEPNKTLKHNVGAVAMANAGRDTAGSQFYIVIGKPAPHLDSGDYTIFGQVIAGQAVAEKLKVGDRMTRITISGGK